jgi:hypothetical protein
VKQLSFLSSPVKVTAIKTTIAVEVLRVAGSSQIVG